MTSHSKKERSAAQKIAALEEQLSRYQRAERLRHKIMTGAATCSGQEYFDQMVVELAQALGADFTFIGELRSPERNRIRSLALCAAGSLAKNLEYDLAHTPCEKVLDDRLCTHRKDVAKLFPKDQLLVEMGIEGYVGVPLYDKKNQPLGIIVALYRQAIVDPTFAETTLQLFANLTAAEIMHRQEQQERLKLQQQYLLLSNEKNGQQGVQIESESILSAVLETLPSPIFYKNRAGIYTGCNQAFCDYLGMRRERIIGRSVHEIAPPKLAEVYHQADQELMAQQGGQTYEAQVRYADGSDHDILFNKATIGEAGGEVLGLVGVMTDISEIRGAETEMLQLRTLLRSIVDSMPSLLITVDIAGLITLWNLQSEKFFSLPAKDVLGRPLKEVLLGFEDDFKKIELALASGEAQKIFKAARTHRGQTYYFDITIYPLVTGGLAGAVVRIDNVTDVVRMEETLVQSEKMLSLGGLAAGMAHEINNPLAAVLQNLQLLNFRMLQETLPNQKAAEKAGIELTQLSSYLQQRRVPEILDMIAKAGQRAAGIIQNMLSFSRKESGPLRPCCVVDLVEQAVDLAKSDFNLRDKFDFRNIPIELQIPPDLPPVLGIDNQLQQVFFNLLTNSAQAMSDWEQMASKPLITILGRCEGDQVLLEISDNGPGISEEDRQRIFEPFFTTKDPGQGTGLGLSVSYFIITETHHGDLSVDTAPSGGACFRLRLPRSAG